ncbi:alpha-galactosidase [Gryllotalpicola reticulitermitis]|uniref:Alpha-galactosidase n=1 Tax=Gryllotalpicola reticulitermitis TaxID=1184153 RepID=A0ABV8Q6F2_9MICO
MTLNRFSSESAGEASPSFAYLDANGTALLLDLRTDRIPSVVHWGRSLGANVDLRLMEEIATAALPPLVTNSLDHPEPVGIVPEHARGWAGEPGLVGHRHGGTGFAPLFSVSDVECDIEPGRGGEVRLGAVDAETQLRIELVVRMSPSGVVRVTASLRNEGDADYTLDALRLTLPVPSTALELLDFSGRHLRERAPQRHPFVIGTHARAGRRGRTGADASLLLIAGQPRFGFETGEVWGVHTAWSGNHLSFAERDSAGISVLGGGEILGPGEITLAPGAAYTAPQLVASYGNGLNELSARIHDELRARPSHPRSPRPVALNTWEAVYFDHRLDKLIELADRAAAIGIERYILDDGWFEGRRDDSAGLGDWYVDERVWPRGLHPLVDHVRDLNMQFGLWFEPEMISINSKLARSHPEWIMAAGKRLPPEGRHQQVLDLGNPDAFAYIFERMSSLIEEYQIDYIKWDHNRDLVDAGHRTQGTPAVHDQTLAVYRLIDELKAHHPGLEIESCSSGGARADLGILERTERIWGSDSIDALERQSIQRWTGLLLPPEMIGSHIGAPSAHTSGRRHDLSFRAGTALFGHLGVEWDITTATPQDLEELGEWVAFYKANRNLLHTGRVVRGDHPDPSHWLHGVVAADGSHALYAFVALRTGDFAPPGAVRLPGLDPEAAYRVTPVNLGEAGARHGFTANPAWYRTGITMTGNALAVVGVQAGELSPEHLQLFTATQVEDPTTAPTQAQ